MKRRLLSGGRFLRQAGAILLPLVGVLGVVALALKLLGLLAAPAPAIVSYASVGEAERRLGRELPIPAYFPDSLRWPPASIRVQFRPTFLLSLRFTTQDGQPRGLDIYEASARAGLPPVPGGAMIQREAAVELRGVAARLTAVVTEGGQRYTRLEWPEGQRYLALESTYPEEAVLLMAQTLPRAP